MVMLYGICKFLTPDLIPIPVLELTLAKFGVSVAMDYRTSTKPNSQQVKLTLCSWIVAAEIFPARIRPITGAFAASLQWFFSVSSCLCASNSAPG
jgi:hypothetical protein